jgi:hypothetical protein
MQEPIRISPQEARHKVTSGSALLVCAYGNKRKFEYYHLQDAISYPEFKSRLESLSKDQEIIFYCA